MWMLAGEAGGGVTRVDIKVRTGCTAARWEAVPLLIVILAALALTLPGCGASSESGSRVAAPASQGPTAAVRVDGGRVFGLDDGAVRVFRGIPYAAPPVGGLRWRPPQPVRPWTGVLACLQFGSSCPQSGAPVGGGRLPASQSEDCLYLNVWTPARAAAERLPVM